MYTLVILHLDGTQTEHEIDGDLELAVDPGDEIAVLDDNGAPAEAELKRDGENLELKLPDSSEVTLNNFYSGAGDSDPATIALSAQSTVEDYAEFEGLVGNLPGSGGFSLMRLSSTGYTDFTDSLGVLGREISALGAADNTPPSGNGFGAPGAGGGDGGGQGGSAASSQNQGGGNGGTTVRNPFSAPAAPAAAVDVNGDPISVNRFHKLEEDGDATIFGTVPVVDPDGDRVFVTIGEGTQYGNFTVDGAGSYSYTPNYADPTIQELNVGDTLVDYATIRLNDDFGNESLSVVKFTISGTNDDPVAAPAFGTVAEPGSDVDVAFATGQVEGGDADNGAVLGFSTTDTPSYGTIAMDAQGNWTYLVDPANNTVQALNVGDSLTETINYEVVDEHGATDTETLTITILGTDDAPVAQPETATIAEDSARVIGQLDATDIDTGASLAFTPASDQSGDQGLGNFTVNGDGIWLFDLDNGHPAVQALADGESIVETFTYEVTDEHGATDTETISVTVTGTNDDPVATDDSASIDENGTPVTIPVLPNDSDVDGDTLTVTSIDDTALTGGTATQVGNDIVFDPGTDFDYLGEGETATETITYTVSDGNGGTDTATVTITVTGGNDGPTAVNDVGTVDEDATTNLDLLDNDTDPDTNDILTITAINGVTAAGVMTLPSGATVAINANGTVDYDPGDVFDYLDDTESATDSFEYTISDGNGGTDTATATITITGNEDPTVIAPDSAATDENTPVVIDVLGNDSDPDTNDNPLTVASVTQPPVGQGTVTNNGTEVTFTPGTDFDDLGEGETEEVTFTYTTNTGATETVTVTVTGTNDGPVAVNDTGAVDEDDTLTVNQVSGVIDDNDTDLDASDVLTVTDIRTGTEAGSGTAGILNDPLTGTYGSLTLQSDGSYTYVADQPAADALAVGITATDTFTYTISDGNGGTDSAEITITVTGTNDAPVAVDDTGSVNEDATLTVNQANGVVDSNDTDLDGDTLTVSDARTDVGTYGTLVLAADGSYSYAANTPAANALAVGETVTDTFSYTISDGNGGTDTADLVITVTGTNDGPTAVDDTATTDEDAAVLNIDLLGDDTDPDGDTLSLTEIDGVAAGGTITLASGALVTVNGDGTVDYDPNGQFNDLDDTESATDSFQYTISDGNGGTDTATATITITGNEDPTVIAPDSAATDENTPAVIDVLGNDSDPDDNDNPLTVDTVTQPAPGQGTVTNNGTNVTFTPGSDFDDLGEGETEEVTFTYTTNTGATETVTVTVTGTNDGPVAVNDTGAVDEDDTLTVNQVSGVIDDNDTDLDASDILTVTDIRTGAETGSGTIGIVGNGLTGTYGTLTLADDGSYAYVADQPAADALAVGITVTDTFTYTISDGNGGTDTAEIVITVTGTNDAPVAVDDTGAVNEDATLVVNQANGLVDNNDSDLDGDTLIVTDARTDVGSYGTLVLAADGSYTYAANTPAANALAVGETVTDTFSYTISDGNGGTDTADLVITVTGTNDGPTAVDDTATTDEDAAVLNIDLLGDDTDPDGDTLSLTEIDGVAAGGTITLASGALVTVNGDGTVDYDPNGQFNNLDDTESATDSFQYTISDGNGGTDTATATITITGNEDPTVIAPDLATTDENTPAVIDVLGNDSDPDDNDNPLTVDTVTQPAPGQGTVTNNGTNVTFTPGSDFDDLGEGETEEVTFTYTTNTGATETVTVTVTGTNDGPVAVNDTGAVDEDDTLTVNQVSGVIDDNDTDLDASDILTVTDIRTGAETGSGTPGLVGGDLTGSYGTLTLADDGSYAYVADQPAADALAVGITATDTFTYTISDGNGGTDSAEIVITVTGTNDAPVAVDDTGAVNEDATLVVNQANGLIDNNDTDLDGDTLTITAGEGITLGTYGTLTLATDGSYSYIATTAAANALAAGETVTDTFSYIISDGNGGTDTADLVITVTGSNDGPTAVDDAATTDEDAAALNIDLLGDDTDPDGDTLSLTEIDGVVAGGTITLASGALVTVNGDGTVDYDPNGQFNNLDDTESATDSFEYTISDGNGGTDTATATITITGNEDPTVIAPDLATTDENTPVVIDVLGNDSDPDDNDNPLTVDTVTQPPANQGTVTNNGTNVTFDPGSDFDDLGEGETEEVTFTYTTNTGATETVTVTVTGTNDGPVAVNDTGAVDEDDTLTVNQVSGVIDDNDTDLDASDILTVTDIRTGPEAGSGTIGIVGNGLAGTYGTLTLADDGSYAYVADQSAADALAVGITATDTFTYTISDGNGGTDSAEIVITVTGTNDAPVAVDDTGSVNEDELLTVNTVTGIVDSNDTDLDGDTLIVTDARTDVGTYGTLVLAADGSYTYAADQPAAHALAAGETATDIFSYFISDSNGGVDTANLTITITGTNDGPTAVDDTATTDEDTKALNIDLLGDDTDPDGDTLSLTEIDGVAAGGTITLASGALVTVNGDGTVDYDPNGQFNNLDDTESATDSFQYTISDGNGGTDTATATITITGNEDPTVIAPDSAATDENSPVVVDVLANDSDPDDNDNPLTVDTVTQPPPNQGTVTNNGTNVTFVPGTDFDDLGEGETEEVTFTYTTNTGATETVTVTVTGTNDGPVAVNDTGAVDEDATLSVSKVSGIIDDNDTDLDVNDTLTVTDIRTGAETGSGTIGIVGNGLTGTYGTLTLADDGSYAYVADQPAADALAVGITVTDTFTYTISDGNGGTDTAEIVITVTGTNDAPVAVDDTGAVNEDATLVVNQANGLVDNNDSDLDGDTLIVTDARTDVGSYGTLVLAADGSYTYAANTPAANALAVGETVTDTFSYTISDGNGGTDTADLVITVTGTNDGPTAVDDTATTDEDAAVLNIDLLGDDTDPDGDTLSLTEIDGVAAGGTITLASGALVTVNGDGTVDYDPNGQFNNLDDTESTTDSFQYTISDGNGGTDTATATITITGNEDPTVIAPDSATTDENTPAVIDVLGNDSDPDDNDNPLTVDTVTQPAPGQGTVTNNGTNVTFVPGSDFDDLGEGETEEVTFTYTTNTGATETVTVTVTGTNDGPVAVNDTGAVDEDATLTVNQVSGVIDDNDTDLDATDVLTVTDVRTGAEAGSGTPGLVGGGLTGTYGTLTLADDGSYAYVADQAAADALAVGITVTDTFTYTVSDGNGGTDTAEIVITVTGTNDAPVAVDDTGAVNEEATLIVNQANGLVDNNDSDLDGDTLTITAGEGITLGIYGTLTLATDGSYSYVATTAAANALAAGETVTDTFSYTISDGNGGTDTADLVITVTGTNDGPTAVDDTATTDEDAAVLNIDLLGDDTDPDGDTLSLTEIDGVAAGGTITLASGALVTVNGDGTVDYDPNGQFNNLDDTESATDSFQYTISDGNGGTDTATATITITGNEDPTVIAPDLATTDENTPVVIDVLGNDSDPDDNDNPLTVDTVTQPPANQGTVTNNGTNVTFDPGSDFDDLGEGETEEVTFTYTTNTGATETVTVTVTGTNDGPVAVNDTGAVDEDATLTVNQVSGVIDDNDTDLDATDVLTVTDVRTGAEAGSGTPGLVGGGLTGTYGTLTLADDGSYAYVADQAAADALAVGITVTDTFTYTVSDGNGGTDTAEIVITVTGTNDAPVAVDDTGAVNEEATLIVNQANGLVDNNDSDLDGDTLTITAGEGITLGIYGTLTLATDGSYSYVATTAAANALAAGETVTDTFSYTISDGNGGTDTADLVITVTGTNDGPTAVDDTATTDEDAAVLNIDLLGDDTDPDGDTLSLTEIDGVAAGGTITLASGALVTVNGDGTVDYDPNGQFNNLDDTESATDSFEYTISDGNGGTDTATATITITGNEDPTVIAPDLATTDENTPVVIDVLGNDSDPDDNDNPLTVDTVTQPPANQGTVTNNGTNVTFTPGTDFDDLAEGETEEVTFTYTTNTGATETVTVTVTGTNDGPVAVNDTGAVDEDATLTVNQVSGVIDDNDTDLDTSDILTVTDIRTGPEAGSGTIGIVGNGLAGTYGTLTLADDGSYAYVADQPAADALAVSITATDTFTYTISDGNGGTDSAEITITVTGTNDAPVAVDDTGAVNEGATLTVNTVTGIVDSNDTDLDGDTLIVTDARTDVGTYGTLVLAADGSYTYTADQPAANALAAAETATDTFSYFISDSNGGTDTADLVITVTGTNDGPTAVDDTATTDEDTKALNIDLLGDDTDPDGDTLSLTEIDGVAAGGTITLASGALVTVNGDGTVDYDPNGQFNNLDDTESATDSFEYTISDGNGGTDTATATITITGNEDPTVIAPDSATTDENTPVVIDVLGNDSDPDDNDNPLTVDTVTQPAPGQGTVTNNGTNVTFTPGSDFDDLGEGETEEVTFTYTTNTGATETVTVTVTGTNDGPVAVNDTGSVDEDATLTVSKVSGIIDDNDNDLDTTDVLTVTDVRTGTEAGSGTPGLVGGGLTGTYGTLTLADDGSYTYVADQPAADALAVGITATDTFTYTISDGNGGTDSAELVITVTGTNDAPIANPPGGTPGIDFGVYDDTDTVAEDAAAPITGDVLTNDLDPDGDALVVSAVNGVAGNVDNALVGTYGTITLDSDGTYSYALDNTNPAVQALEVGQSTTETFTYTADDGNGGTATATLTITITGSNHAPTVSATAASVFTEAADASAQDLSQSGTVSFDDVDTSDDIDITFASNSDISWSGGSLPAGLATQLVNGFSTSATDAAAPGSTSWDYSATGLDLDFLAVGESITFSYDVTATDTYGATATDTVTITINGANDAPDTHEDCIHVLESKGAAIDVIQNDQDADHASLTITEIDGTAITSAGAPISLASGATVAVLSDGTVHYNASGAYESLSEGETATDSFTYTVSDGAGGTTTETVNVQILGEPNTSLTGSYQVVSGQLYEYSYNAATDSIVATAVGPDPANAGEYNAIAFNPADGLIYGVDGTSGGGTGNLISIDPTTGIVTQLPFAATIPTANAGEINPVDGHLYLKIGTNDVISVVNLTTGAEVRTFSVGYIVSDFTYDPMTDLFWAGVDLSSNLISFDSLGNVTTYSGAFPESSAWGAALADAGGSVSIFSNTTGNFYSIDTSDGSTALIGTNIPSSSNDGAGDSSGLNSLFASYLSLDPDNSTGAGGNAANMTFVAGGADVGLTDGVVDIDNLGGGDVTQIEVILRNPQTGDSLNAGTLPGTISAATSTNALGQTVVTLTGAGATPGDFEDAVEAITFGNPEATPVDYPRTIDVVISSGNGYVTTSTSTVYVSGGATVGSLPDQTTDGATDDQALTTEDQSVVIDLLKNDSDNPTSIASIIQPPLGQGAVVDNLDGTVTFDPGTDFDDLGAGQTEEVTFTYTTDTGATETVAVTVIGKNDGPTAQDDTATTDEDTPVLNIDVLGNDTDPENDTLSVVSAASAPNGTVTVNGDGTLNYTPNPGFNGTDVVTYAISDGNGGSDVASVTIMIDNDGDGVDNATDVDDDNDGILDTVEACAMPTSSNFVPGTGEVATWSTPDSVVVGSTSGVGANALYTNTGTFEGQAFDVKLTITGQPSVGSQTYGFRSNYIGILLPGLSFIEDWIDLKLEFFVAGTTTPLVANSGIVVNDIDATGGLRLDESIVSSLHFSDPTSLSSTVSGGEIEVLGSVFANSIPEQSVVAIIEGQSSINLSIKKEFDNSGYGFFDYTHSQFDICFDDVDGDGLANHLDIDSDNDGITDNVEAQATQDYIAPSGTGSAITDVNNDGLDDSYDNTTAAGALSGASGVGLSAVDTDGDGGADFYDLDSDNDGIQDVAERGDGQPNSEISSVDSDGDGLLDIFEGSNVNDGHDVNDENLDATDTIYTLADSDNDTAADGSNAIPTGTDLDYRDAVGVVPPIAIDLDGDGVEFDSVEEGILLDVDGDGELERTAWADEDDGVLIYDGNDNGNVDGASEFAFASYSDLAGATDLEGLRAGFDTDDDGLLSSRDEQFDRFKVWQDADGDGLVGEGELNSLQTHGIESIGLVNDGERYVAADGDVFVYGESQVQYADGTTGTAADAAFDYREIVEEQGADEDLTIVANDGSILNLDQPAPTIAAGTEGGTESPTADAPAPAPSPAPAEPVTPPPPAAPASLDDDAAAAAAAAAAGAM